MTWKTRRKIDKAFFGYKRNMASGVRSTVAWAESGVAVDYSRPKVQSSDRTAKERKLCEIIDDEMTAYRWCRVVENVLIRYEGDARKVLIEQHFFERQTFAAIGFSMNIGRSTIFRWLNEIRETAVIWAEKYKLI